VSAGAWEVGRVFLKLGAVSYGGPAMMGIMQAEIERKRQWVTPPQPDLPARDEAEEQDQRRILVR
jgi:hypothetical protein